MTEIAPAYQAARLGRRPPDEADASAIRRNAPLPYYVQLADVLRDNIARGHWAPGEALPAEADVCTFFGVSRTVVRQALNELVADGLVHKEKGRGTFVSKPKIAELVVHEMRGFFDEMAERGVRVETEVLRQAIVTVPPQVAPELGVSMRSEVLHLTRVRRADGDAIVKVDTYLPLPRFASLADADLTDRSLYHLMVEEYGVFAQGGWRRVEAVAAGGETAELLEIEPRSPVLALTAVTVDQDDVPFEWFRALYRGDRTSFEARIGREPRAPER